MLTLTSLQLAGLLLEHYPLKKAQADAHLDCAIGELCDTKIERSLESALKLAESPGR